MTPPQCPQHSSLIKASGDQADSRNQKDLHFRSQGLSGNLQRLLRCKGNPGLNLLAESA